MKNKKLQLILIPLVLLLWGAIGYRVYTGLVPEDVVVTQNPPSVLPKPETNNGVAYEPVLDYADPFLKNNRRLSSNISAQKQKTSSVKVSKTKIERQKEAKPIRWPDLVYKGQLEKTNGGQTLCIVEIDRQLHFLHEGEVIGDVRLEGVYADSLVMEYQGRAKKTLYKK
jgi:hypothetical protein